MCDGGWAALLARDKVIALCILGRKPAIYAGFALYIVGSLLSMVSAVFPMLLVGRLVQGIGVSSPRAVTLALVRDQYEGRAMARVMSFVMTVFSFVPMIAPTMGQAVLLFAGEVTHGEAVDQSRAHGEHTQHLNDGYIAIGGPVIAHRISQ